MSSEAVISRNTVISAVGVSSTVARAEMTSSRRMTATTTASHAVRTSATTAGWNVGASTRAMRRTVRAGTRVPRSVRLSSGFDLGTGGAGAAVAASSTRPTGRSFAVTRRLRPSAVRVRP